MFRLLTRNLLLLGLLGAAVYGPRAISDGNLMESLQKLLRTGGAAGEGADPPAADRFSTAARPPAAADGTRAVSRAGDIRVPVVRRSLIPFDQLLRFDVTPAWVTSRFQTVSLLPSDAGQGMRTSVVTGTSVSDLAGVLTYYFDDKQMVQRITLDAATGDPARLAAFLADKYRLKEQQDRRGVFLCQWNRTPISGMVVRSAAVIRRDQPQSNYHVRVELNRPKNYVRMSDEFSRLLAP